MSAAAKNEKQPAQNAKRIVIISPAFPLRGGIAASAERLAEEFLREGHAVQIFSFSLQYPNFLFPGKTQFSDDAPPQNLDIQTVINSINPFNWLSVGRKIARLKPDLVICRFWIPFMSPCLGTILRAVRRNKFSKIVGLVDNIVPHEKRFGDRLFAQYFASACEGFVVMSRSVEAELRQFSDRRIAFVPHPIYDIYGEKVSRDVALDFLKLDKTPRYILFFGFIRHYKGLDILLEAMQIVSRRRHSNDNVSPEDAKNTEGLLLGENEKRKNPNRNSPSPILIIAGEFYDDEKFYTERIKTLSIENQVIVHSDFIPSDDVKYYFGAADLIVQPYRTATQSGISQVAYHFEKPMIVSNVGGLPEIVPHGEAGYVVEPTPQYIADAMADFFENDRADTFALTVLAQKKRFSWAAMTEAFLSF